MTTSQADEPGATVVSDVRAADESEIVRRAEHLCRRAEPHAESVPCQAHVHEAQRQLFGPAL